MFFALLNVPHDSVQIAILFFDNTLPKGYENGPNLVSGLPSRTLIGYTANFGFWDLTDLGICAHPSWEQVNMKLVILAKFPETVMFAKFPKMFCSTHCIFFSVIIVFMVRHSGIAISARRRVSLISKEQLREARTERERKSSCLSTTTLRDDQLLGSLLR